MGGRGRPCSFRPYCGGRMGGHLGCSVCEACHVVRFVFGRSLGPFPGAAQPYSTLTAAAFPLARAQGWVYPCVLMHESCARLSPCGESCVSGYVHVCVCQLESLPIIPILLPTGRLCFAACVTGGRPSPFSWVRTSAGLLLSPLGARWCVLRGSFPSGFFSRAGS
jgi:hypothetical protein